MVKGRGEGGGVCGRGGRWKRRFGGFDTWESLGNLLGESRQVPRTLKSSGLVDSKAALGHGQRAGICYTVG